MPTNKKNDTTNNYEATDIKILEGLEAVRKRPGMYIGSTGYDGVHYLIKEIADNSIDDVLQHLSDSEGKASFKASMTCWYWAATAS